MAIAIRDTTGRRLMVARCEIYAKVRVMAVVSKEVSLYTHLYFTKEAAVNSTPNETKARIHTSRLRFVILMTDA